MNAGRAIVAVVCVGLAALGGGRAAADPTVPADVVVADFEGHDFGDWKSTGTAFSHGPALGDLPGKLQVSNYVGNGAACSDIDGDGPTGTLTSPPFKIERRYLSFLIGGGNYERDTCFNLLVDGKVVRSATGFNSDRMSPVSWDVSALAGQTVQVQMVDNASGRWGHVNVDQIVQTDKPDAMPVMTGPLYQETLRPQFHFTARQWTIDRLNPRQRQEGWCNDLNGLIYYDGEYHLFAQRWAKCWIHAVSRDLVHWTELQPAFWEESLGTGVQSGTCVIDYQNTSGLSPDKANPPMVAFWSRFDNHSQCMSYSLDHGRTWKLYEKNPLFDHPNRDPKVFWYEPGKHWVMVMYGDDQYHILTSSNLLDWKDEHHPIPKCFECPDLFELPIDGKADQKKWVLIQGNGRYSIGTFNGIEFKEETERLSCDIGPNFYATQSWANTETGDGRRVQAAWMRGGIYPQMPFNQQVSFPCELTLHTTPAGLRVFREPVKEIESLHLKPDQWTERKLEPGDPLTLAAAGESFHIRAEVTIPEKGRLTFNLLGSQVVFTPDTVISGRVRGTVQEPIRTIEILVDRTSIEAFANHGELSTSRCILPTENGMTVTADGGAVVLHSMTVYPMKSAWVK
jgi:fructan beta-fructosidase